MAVTNGYCTLQEFKEWTSAPSDKSDDEREAAINAASRSIDEFCQTFFYETLSEPRFFDGDGTDLLELGARNPLSSPEGVSVDTTGDGVFDEVWTASDWQALPLNKSRAGQPFTEIAAVGDYGFDLNTNARWGNIQVDGLWGWSDVPADIHLACMLLANRNLSRRDSPVGIVAGVEFVFRVSAAGDPDVARLITPFKADYGVA